MISGTGRPQENRIFTFKHSLLYPNRINFSADVHCMKRRIRWANKNYDDMGTLRNSNCFSTSGMAVKFILEGTDQCANCSQFVWYFRASGLCPSPFKFLGIFFVQKYCDKWHFWRLVRMTFKPVHHSYSLLDQPQILVFFTLGWFVERRWHLI